MILTSDYKWLNHQANHSFSDLINDIKTKYSLYRNSLMLEQKILKASKKKHNDLVKKIEYLTKILEESNPLFEHKKKKLLEIDIKKYENIADYFNSKVFSFLLFSSKSSSISNFKKILENFNYLHIPDWMIETKSENIWKDCAEFEEFISFSIDCKIKHDLLNIYHIRKLNIEREIYIQGMRIESLENRIKNIMKNLEFFEENSKTETQEQEFVLGSDELYGDGKGITDTSTMIFEGSPLCSSSCCIIS